ncbi:MAG: VWA domain-containing protein [Acidobacteria bacterium]|nr:VWA domain-containing protein [Acidobacteriota bacterium]
MEDAKSFLAEHIGTIPPDAEPLLRTALSPAAPLIASATGIHGAARICIWDYWTSEIVGEVLIPTDYPDLVWPCSFSPDGNHLLLAAAGEGPKAFIVSGPWATPSAPRQVPIDIGSALDVVRGTAWLDAHTVLIARLYVGLVSIWIVDIARRRSALVFSALSHEDLQPKGKEIEWSRNHYYCSAICTPAGDVAFVLHPTETEYKVVWVKVDRANIWKEDRPYIVLPFRYPRYLRHLPVTVHLASRCLLLCHNDEHSALPVLSAYNYAGEYCFKYPLDFDRSLDVGNCILQSAKDLVMITDDHDTTHIYRLNSPELEKLLTLEGRVVHVQQQDSSILALIRKTGVLQRELVVLKLKSMSSRKAQPERVTPEGFANEHDKAPAPPYERASDLYRELRRRGLHLRGGNGRDDALLEDLSRNLKCDGTHIQEFLEKSDLSAEDFLLAFMLTAMPFAIMYLHIWDYLAQHKGSRANESLAVRFGFPADESKTPISLDEFRRQITTLRWFVSTVRIWSAEAIRCLYKLYSILLKDDKGGHAYKYEEGDSLNLTSVECRGHKFDELASNVRQLFQDNIDAFRRLRCATEGWASNELKIAIQRDEDRGLPVLRLAADLLPFWIRVFEIYPTLRAEIKDEALRFYLTELEPLLVNERRMALLKIRLALDILDLPFWRQRWHTYEIWASIATLEALEAFRPTLRVVDGYVPLDGYRAEVVADLASETHKRGCVAIQVQTLCSYGRRKAIKPDLRVMFSDALDAEQTAAIVEFKQRRRLSNVHLKEVLAAYKHGSPRCGGVLLLNYDEVHFSGRLPSGCHVLGGLQPCNPGAMAAFKQKLGEALERAGMRPACVRVIVLLDVSSSMGDCYRETGFQKALATVLELREVKVFAFNDGLVSNDPVDKQFYEGLRTSGNTNLGKALEQLQSINMFPDRLLVVSDGRYHCIYEIWERIGDARVCTPDNVVKHVGWLVSSK